MKKIILVSATFPYGDGETFLETEMKYLSERNDISISILPILKMSDKKREISKNVFLEKSLILGKHNGWKMRVFYVVKSLQCRIFYKELFSNNLFNLIKMKYFLLSISRYQMFYTFFDRWLQNKENVSDTIIYSYWHTESTYALQTLQSKYKYKLISRIHGGDLYEKSRPASYMPLKKQFQDNIDGVFTITPSAKSYLIDNYGFNKEKIMLSRLGVIDYGIKTKASVGEGLHLVSCSSLSEIKQVDKIIKALARVSLVNREVILKWTHIGDGPLAEELKELATNLLGSFSNISFEFLGVLKNKEVYDFYKKNEIDVFINTSRSEGAPVSIMEAMSCHIPIIAPNIGGISDMLIDKENGYLLSEACTIYEISDALRNIDFFKDENIRYNAYKVFSKKYNAKLNYRNFIENITRKI